MFQLYALKDKFFFEQKPTSLYSKRPQLHPFPTLTYSVWLATQHKFKTNCLDHTLRVYLYCYA